MKNPKKLSAFDPKSETYFSFYPKRDKVIPANEVNKEMHSNVFVDDWGIWVALPSILVETRVVEEKSRSN